MIPSLLGFSDNEETRGLPINLQLLTVYSYADYFMLKINMAISRVRSNILIDRKSGHISE